VAVCVINLDRDPGRWRSFAETNPHLTDSRAFFRHRRAVDRGTPRREDVIAALT
jgi:hypothetical protein